MPWNKDSIFQCTRRCIARVNASKVHTILHFQYLLQLTWQITLWNYAPVNSNCTQKSKQSVIYTITFYEKAAYHHEQRAKKVGSNSPGLVDFAISRVVTKGQGPGISPGYSEHGPWLLSSLNETKRAHLWKTQRLSIKLNASFICSRFK